MSGLLFLSARDFNVQRGTKGPILCNVIKGYSLVMFYSTHCRKCQTLIPIFKQLPGTINGCQFGMINIGNNKQCIEMAKQTITPIQYVPLIILYINGKPFMRYPPDSPDTIESLQKFIIQIAENVKQKQQFSKKAETVKSGNNDLETMLKGIGIPLCTECCYMNETDAYPQRV